jgi:preprotein translocase subunit SecD
MRRGLVWSLIGFIAVAVLSLGGTLAAGRSILLGLDLKGGVSVVLAPSHSVDNATLAQAVSIIERRVNGLGVSNADVQRQGQDVVISLPGIKNSQGALKTLGTTAELFFRPVYCQIPDYTKPTPASTHSAGTGSTSATTTKSAAASLTKPGGSSARLDASVRSASPATTTASPPTTAASPATTTASGGTTTPATTTPATTTPSTTAPSNTGAGANVPLTAPTTVAAAQADCSAANVGNLPSTSADAIVANKPVIVPAAVNSGYTNRFILGPADLTGRAVKTAFVSLPQGSASYAVELTFTGAGSKEFNKMAAVRNQFYNANATTPSVQSLEAIELDGVLESAPQIQQSNFNGSAQITGNFTEPQASDLALVLKYGSLPVRFDPQQVQTVSATVGQASLRAGLLAGLGGLLVVMLYMIIYYRALGLVVVAGLGLASALLYAILAQLSQSSNLTLTLAGVTGIIVAIGITVDSYVVYFERLKDEIRAGRTVRQSVDRAFARAFRTVLTADAVSFLAALILYLLTVGDVRGFAFMLGLATLLDVLTAYFFIRPAVILLGRRRTFTEAPVLGIGRGLGQSSKVGADV